MALLKWLFFDWIFFNKAYPLSILLNLLIHCRHLQASLQAFFSKELLWLFFVTQKHVLITASTTSNVVHCCNHTLIYNTVKVTHFVFAASNGAHHCNHTLIDGTVKVTHFVVATSHVAHRCNRTLIDGTVKVTLFIFLHSIYLIVIIESEFSPYHFILSIKLLTWSKLCFVNISSDSYIGSIWLLLNQSIQRIESSPSNCVTNLVWVIVIVVDFSSSYNRSIQ